MLKWASLLHDISKRSKPLIQGKDHIHPFISAVTTLDILQNLNLIPDIRMQGAKIFQIKRLMSESVQPLLNQSGQ